MTKTHDIEHDVTDAAHRARCAECTALWAELDLLSAEAARLPLLHPSRDLWPGIEARIEGVAGAIGGSAQGSGIPTPVRRSWSTRRGVQLALAASLLVAVSSGITWQLATRGSVGRSAVAADLSSGVDGEMATALHLASFQSTVRSMDKEIAELELLVAERRETLDPHTIDVLETNLRVIDRAIMESRAALIADPASRFLSEQFTNAYSSKLTLLRDAASLPIGI